MIARGILRGTRCLLLLALIGTSAFAEVYSELWGKAGERWSADSRLPDFSFAGYQAGEQTLPAPEVRADVRAFGAKGDGETDDTAAFNAAIAATPRGAVLVPPGRYKITGLLRLARSGVVLRGESAERSILWFPNSLSDVEPNWRTNSTGQRTSHYSWSGGFIRIDGEARGQERLAEVTEPFARRGDEWLAVSATEGFAPGRWVRLRMIDDEEKSLLRWIYNDEAGAISALKIPGVTQVARVREIDAARRRVRLDRPLRYELRPEWSPVIEGFVPAVTEAGVERLGFEFPSGPYEGHFRETGYNAIEIGDAAHCWVRDLRIVNADSGVFVKGVHCTVADVVFESVRAPVKDDRGHHGISITGADNLITRFDFRQRFVHDLSVETWACAGNVFSEGRGVDLCLDHHKRAPHANLFTALDFGAGTRVWQSGGGAERGKNTGGWGTFWNLRTPAPIAAPHPNFGPSTLNIVGFKARAGAKKPAEGRWYEIVDPAALVPANLHAAQLEKRLGHRLAE